MAEEALKRVGCSINNNGIVFNKEQDCVGYVKNDAFISQPMYEPMEDDDTSVIADISSRKLVESVANKLGLEVVESEIDPKLLSIKTDKPENMPTAVIAYQQLKTGSEYVKKTTKRLLREALEGFNNSFNTFSKDYEKTFLENVKTEEKKTHGASTC